MPGFSLGGSKGYTPGEGAKSISALSKEAITAAAGIGSLGRQLGTIDFGKLSAAVREATASVEKLAQPAAAAAPAGAGAAGPSTQGQDFGASIAQSLTPLIALTRRLEAAFDRVGGTVVTLARRIDASMKAASVDMLAAKVRSVLPGAFSKAAFDSVRSIGKIVGALRNMGDVAGKNLSQIRGMRLAAPIADVTKLALGVTGVGIAAKGATSYMAALGPEIAVALGFFGAAAGTVAFFGAAVKGASDLAETTAAAGEVFKTSFGSVNAQVEDLAQKFGLSKRAQLDVAAGFGSLAQGAGMGEKASAEFANTFTQLTADLASFKNLRFEDAAQKLTSGLAGEAEPLRRFGILVDEAAVKERALALGLAKSGEELSVNAKMTARASLIRQGLSNASGDLARTQDGVANRMRALAGTVENLTASVGQSLMPVVQPALAALGKLGASAAAAFESVKPQVEALAGSVFPALGKGAAVVADYVQMIATVLGDIATAGAPGVSAQFAMWTAPIRMAIKAVQSYFEVVSQSWTALAIFSDELFGTNLFNRLEGMKSKLGEMMNAIKAGPQAGSWGDGIRGFFDGITAAAKGTAVAVGGVGKSLADVGSPVGKFAEGLAKLEHSLMAKIAAVGRGSAADDLYTLKTKGATDADIARARSLGMMFENMKAIETANDALKDAAKASIQESLTPLEKYDAKINELQTMLDKGLIDSTTFNRLSSKEFKEAGIGEKRFAGAAEFGGREAYSAILNRGKDDREGSIKAVAKTSEKQLTEAEKQTPLLQKMLDAINGKAGIEAYAMSS
jgi:hypothetical protein